MLNLFAYKSNNSAVNIKNVNTFKLASLMIIFSACFDVSASDELEDKQDEYGSQVEFESSFLNVSNSSLIDLSRFSGGANATPGIYKVQLYLNDMPVYTGEIELKENKTGNIVPCFTQDLIERLNLKFSALPDGMQGKDFRINQCINLESEISGSKVKFDSSEQALYVTIPQIFINNAPRGSVSSSMWDSGIPAFIFNYNTNAYINNNNGKKYQSVYSGLNGGLNVGSWYLRHNGTYSWNDASGSNYDNLNSYLQKDIPIINGRFLAGQSNTSGQIFDSLPFTGIQIISDERMLPDSQRGYAPEIRGIARSNARVIVKQLDQIIYETTVPAGTFLINDLYPTGFGGDLTVSVQEADGSERIFTLPYASVNQLLRPGSSRYELTVGKLRTDYVSDTPELVQGTWQQGINNILTAYTGTQLSKDYYSLQGGIALGTTIGAYALDITHAETKLPQSVGGKQKGQSYRVSYSKNFTETDSNITFAAYRFSTRGYMDFLTAMQTLDEVNNNEHNNVYRSKYRYVASASQGLGDGLGQIYLSANILNYWNREGYDKNYQIGYTNNFKSITYSLSVSRSKSAYGEEQNNYFLNFSLPLGDNTDNYTPQLYTSYNQSNKGDSSEQVSIHGVTGEEQQLTYNVSGSHNNANDTSASLNGNYKSRVANFDAGYSTGKEYHNFSVGMSGTVVAHSDGVTFSPYSSNTYALIEAKGAEGASVGYLPGLKIDSNGYALLPSLNPYQMNEVFVNPEGISDEVEFENTSQKVAPNLGAVVKLKYRTQLGVPVLITTSADGDTLPFGADVIDGNNVVVGHVTQGGQVYGRLYKDKDALTVKWGDDYEQACKIDYALTKEQKNKKGIRKLNLECHKMHGING